MSQQSEAIEKDINAFLARFMENHFPCSVRVFVTMKEGDKCFGESFGKGDFYSIFGYLVDWVDVQRERNRVEVRKNNASPADPEGGIA